MFDLKNFRFRPFSSLTAPASPPPLAGCIVNYVWMDADKSAPAPIPSHFFYRVQSNAALYPDTQFYVWEENEGASSPYACPDNVVIRRLKEVPAFSSIPLLASCQPAYIWAKVDIARLVVLKHVLEENPGMLALYSDFDTKDVKLGSPLLKDRIDRYHCAFASTITPNESTKSIFENGYMAFAEGGKPLLDFLIKNCLKVATDSGTIRNPHFSDIENFLYKKIGLRSIVYNKMWQALDIWARKNKHDFPRNWRETVGGFQVVYPCLWHGDENLRAKKAVRPRLDPASQKKMVLAS